MRQIPVAQMGEIRMQLDNLKHLVGAPIEQKNRVLGMFKIAYYTLNDLEKVIEAKTANYLIESFEGIMHDISRATYPLPGKLDEAKTVRKFLIRAVRAVAMSKSIVPLTEEWDEEEY